MGQHKNKGCVKTHPFLFDNQHPLARSLITSPAMISPAVPGTKAVEPGMDLRPASAAGSSCSSGAAQGAGSSGD